MKRNLFRLIVCVMIVLTVIIAPVSTAYAASTMKLMKVNVDEARLREGPGDYEVITTLDKGEKVFYSGKMENAFCLICTADGEIGYIFRDFLSNYGVIRADQVYYAISGGTRMYKTASTSASTVEKLNRHEFVIVYKTAGNWAYARDLNGRGGYIPLSKLEKAS